MQVQRQGIVLAPRSDVAWEAAGVFNASVVYDDDTKTFHMLYRALKNGFESFKVRGMDVHWKGFVSSIGYASSVDGLNWVAATEPWLAPDQPWRAHGVEDPRISRFDNDYYVHYTAVAEEPYLGLLAFEEPYASELANKKHLAHDYVHIATLVTHDFVTRTDHGITGPSANSKAAALLPRRVNGKIGLLATTELSVHKMSIVYVEFDDIEQLHRYEPEHWAAARPVLEGVTAESATDGRPSGFELGACPIETEVGWLLIISEIVDGLRWEVGAALLDLEDPSVVTHRLPKPILTPETDWERSGRVDNVCFPEAALAVDGELYIYYGAGDQHVALATCALDELLNELQMHPVKRNRVVDQPRNQLLPPSSRSGDVSL